MSPINVVVTHQGEGCKRIANYAQEA
jgi:hypothetical protein